MEAYCIQLQKKLLLLDLSFHKAKSLLVIFKQLRIDITDQTECSLKTVPSLTLESMILIGGEHKTHKVLMLAAVKLA